MGILDHLFILLFVIVIPWIGTVSFQRLAKQVAAGHPVNRADLYLQTVAGQWILLLIALLGWAYSGRPWEAIGFALTLDRRFLLGAALVLVSIVALAAYVRQARTASPSRLVKLRRSFSGLSFILPKNGNELTRFYGVSVTAGIVEEILWRGILLWYLAHFLPVWAAALTSSVLFGIAHAYQGLAKIPAVVAVGVGLAGLYLLTGSIWLPIIMHAAIDILMGRFAYEVLHRSHLQPDEDRGGGSVPAA